METKSFKFIYNVNDIESYNFTDDTELNCVTIGFISFGENKGFLGHTSVKFGPNE